MLFYVVKSIAEYYYLNHHGCPNLYIGFSFSWASRRKFCFLSKIETHFSHLHFLKGKWCPTNYNVSPLKAGTLFYFLLFHWHLYLVRWSSINLCWMVNKQKKCSNNYIFKWFSQLLWLRNLRAAWGLVRLPSDVSWVYSHLKVQLGQTPSYGFSTVLLECPLNMATGFPLSEQRAQQKLQLILWLNLENHIPYFCILLVTYARPDSLWERGVVSGYYTRSWTLRDENHCSGSQPS